MVRYYVVVKFSKRMVTLYTILLLGLNYRQYVDIPRSHFVTKDGS